MALAALTAASALSLPAQAPVNAAPLAAVAGAAVQVTGAPVELDAQGRLRIFDGAHLTSGASTAQLDLSRGGAIRICGPARLDLTAGGAGALLIALQAGGLDLRYAAAVADSLLTPDFRVSTVVPPQQMATVSANAALAPDGTLCLSNRGSALLVDNLWSGDRRYVIGGQSLEFHPNGAVSTAASCPCAAPPPPLAPAADAAAEGALFPSAPALSIDASNGGPNSTAPAASAPQPAPRAHHHNVLMRFLRWLAGK